MTAFAARIPNETRVTTAIIVLAAILAGVAFAGGLLAHAPTMTRTVRVAQTDGTPDQSVPASAVFAPGVLQQNPALASWTCDVYGAKAKIVCHR